MGGEVYLDGKVDAIRNPEGIWINSQVFREAGQAFMKYGYYIADPWGSPDWFEFWQQERDRMINGYTVGGVKITGGHYMYLNYCPIRKVEDTSRHKGSKITGFPDFWDGDYNYFWVREIARDGILDSLEEDEEEKTRVLELPSLEQAFELKGLFEGLNLEVKIETDYLNGGYNLIVGKSRRKGYQLPHSEIVMTPYGKKTMGDMKVGDLVSTPNGEATILEMFPQGEDDVYEVTLYDGRKVKCGKEHLWKIYSAVHSKDYRQEKVVQTDFLLGEDLKTKKGYRWFLPLNEEVENRDLKELPIPPYTLGALLGDGNVTRQPKLSGADEEVFDKVLEELNSQGYKNSYEFNPAGKFNQQLEYNFDKEELAEMKRKGKLSKFANSYSPIFIALQKLNLNCKSDYKYIPEDYKYHSTIEQRYELIKGMMDTDGYISKDGAMSFANVSKILVEDLQEVLYSLGITSTFRNRKDGLFILYINTDIDIFNVGRKSSRVIKGRKSRNYIAITEVKKLDYREESSCFLIDSEDHLFLTNKYVVTHNSYKNAAIAVNNYYTKPGSLTIFNAYEKKFLYPKGIMTMAQDYINFINMNTGLAMPSDLVDRQDHVRASYIEYKNGIKMEKGFMSELMASTCKDNPDVNRGKDAEDIIVEEAGAFGSPGLLKDLYSASEDCVKAGAIQTGLITIFGTSGDLSGGTVDYADMYERPRAFSLLPFQNIWDKDSLTQSVGFFHPINWNMEGFYDEQGNSNYQAAMDMELEERRSLVDHGATSSEIQKRMQEKPLTPSEAFSAVSFNNFPTIELKAQLQKVKAMGWQKTMSTPVELSYKEGKVFVKPILDGSAEPITSYHVIPVNKRGCPVIYEMPVNEPPRGLYKIGYDPVRQDQGTSLASICVYKSVHTGTNTKDVIVAEYIGRYEDLDDIDRVAEMFADLYNTTIMHENEVTGVKNYFRRIKRLNLLAAQPDAVISKNIKKSKVARVYGCHMTGDLKDAGERYVKQWLLKVLDYDENGDPIRAMDKIYSIRLLEELIEYDRNKNFDYMSSLFMCMFQVQEEELDKEHESGQKNRTAEQLLEMMEHMHTNNQGVM